VTNRAVQSPIARAIIAVAIAAILLALLVVGNPTQLALWLKAFHVITVIAWMAGMLYLPRLFVYHCEAEIGSKQSETFKVMERRLLRAIINPAMIATWVLGLWLAWDQGFFRAGWLHAKLTLVVVLSGVHGLFSRWVRDFAADRNTHSQKFYRVINEVPTLLMVGIVILVIVKPF
jgi:protoporphyrinogen IX oxidase